MKRWGAWAGGRAGRRPRRGERPGGSAAAGDRDWPWRPGRRGREVSGGGELKRRAGRRWSCGIAELRVAERRSQPARRQCMTAGKLDKSFCESPGASRPLAAPADWPLSVSLSPSRSYGRTARSSLPPSAPVHRRTSSYARSTRCRRCSSDTVTRYSTRRAATRIDTRFGEDHEAIRKRRQS
jgi:hypothetical protein